MRIRSTKPEFWRSKTIAAKLDWNDRLVLKALEGFVDDNGVGKDNVVLFCTEAFPYDVIANGAEVFAKVSRSLARFSEVGLTVRYSVGGEELVYVRRWKQWQYIDKPKAGRYPRPDGTMNYRDEVDESIGAGQGVTDPVGDGGAPEPPADFEKSAPKPPEEGPRIQSGEQGNRGTGEQDDDRARDDEPPPPEPPDFEPDVVVAPTYIETPHRPAKRYPSSASKTVVRQVLGNAGYPRTIQDRLAFQVEKLFHEGHPDTLVRQALTEWDRREDCSKPEFLPTVLGDLVKQSRAAPGNNGRPKHKMRLLAELAQQVEAEEQHGRKELP